MTHYIQSIICVQPEYSKQKDRISPVEFLKWSRTDLKGSDRRAIGNAIGNIKRAIHCRLDEIIDLTHISICEDWNPYCNTETKLEVVRKLGIPFDAVVALITEIRNTYEHNYQLPKLEAVRAYCDVAELWLNDSLTKCQIGRISLVNFPLQGFSSNGAKKGNIFTSFQFGGVEEVMFFWNPKKQVIRLNKMGVRSAEEMAKMKWRDMLLLESPFIRKALHADSHMTINQASTTYLFTAYEKWVIKTGQQAGPGYSAQGALSPDP